MKKSSLFRSTRSVALMASMVLACSASFAGGGHGHGDKHEEKKSHGHGEDWDHGHSHGKKFDHDRRHSEHGERVARPQGGPQVVEVRVGSYFGPQHRGVIHTYYGEEFRSGHCPPGLAKKNNGCMPPGQAKRYVLGQPLPREVVYYPLPPAVSVQLGTPPSGYKYVRVASDILLIAVGTSLVVDAIQDLGGL